MSSTNQYDPYRREHRVPCQRTKCRCLPEHPGGRHLDQRDELYDGPHQTLQVAPLAVRDSARKIVVDAPAYMPEVMDLINYIQWQRDQITHIRADKERSVSNALALSASCEHHAEEIFDMKRQVTAISDSYQRADAGRVALLGLLHAVDEVVLNYRETLTAKTLVTWLAKAAKRASAAHDRAWKR